jgi:hypothetical protein
MKRLSILLLALILITAACTPPATAPVTSTPQGSSPFPFPLRADSTSEQIRQALLLGATRWQTLSLDGTLTQFAADGVTPTQVFREQAWIELSTGRFRVLVSGPDGAAAQALKYADGMTVVAIDLINGQSQSLPMPEFERGGYVPPVQEGTVFPQPLWGQIGTALSELAFSSNFAQNPGHFAARQLDQIAGRETLLVEWTFAGNALPSWRLWLDTQTAVILKLQNFEKGGGAVMQTERVVDRVVFDAPLDAALFRAPAEPPQFDAAAGATAGPIETAPAASPESEAAGELYFFTLPHQQGQSVQLVRLPGACVTGAAACPALESIPAPFPFNFNLSALAWAPDGSLAAFAYPDNLSGTPYKLWLFDPGDKSWRSIAEFPFIDPPFWSPDGAHLAFRVQDGVGGENVYVVQRDGSGLRNITASGALPAEARPYVMDGWITENLILRSALPGREGTVFLARAGDGAIRPLFETLLTKAIFVPSPDGAWLAYDDYDYQSQRHALRVTEPDAAHPLDLAAFAGGTLYPIVWTRFADRLAFAHSSTDSGFNPKSDVYVVGRDSAGLTQVYQGVTIGRLAFSPDGEFLLVEETTSPTGGHLFVVNLTTLEARILQAPGLSLDTDWYAPSWRP